jgi:hypothetical protein
LQPAAHRAQLPVKLRDGLLQFGILLLGLRHLGSQRGAAGLDLRDHDHP